MTSFVYFSTLFSDSFVSNDTMSINLVVFFFFFIETIKDNFCPTDSTDELTMINVTLAATIAEEAETNKKIKY